MKVAQVTICSVVPSPHGSHHGAARSSICNSNEIEKNLWETRKRRLFAEISKCSRPSQCDYYPRFSQLFVVLSSSICRSQCESFMKIVMISRWRPALLVGHSVAEQRRRHADLQYMVSQNTWTEEEIKSIGDEHAGSVWFTVSIHRTRCVVCHQKISCLFVYVDEMRTNWEEECDRSRWSLYHKDRRSFLSKRPDEMVLIDFDVIDMK